MAWITTVPATPDHPEVVEKVHELAELYPEEYAAGRRGEYALPDAVRRDSIMSSHSLIPRAMFHAFATFAELMDPGLPLSRRQHEMIATTVSALNRCFF